jgi:hypothetical protein
MSSVRGGVYVECSELLATAVRPIRMSLVWTNGYGWEMRIEYVCFLNLLRKSMVIDWIMFRVKRLERRGWARSTPVSFTGPEMLLERVWVWLWVWCYWNGLKVTLWDVLDHDFTGTSLRVRLDGTSPSMSIKVGWLNKDTVWWYESWVRLYSSYSSSEALGLKGWVRVYASLCQ